MRDAVAVYLLENHVRSLGDDGEEDGSCSQMANAVIRRFCSKEVGWLEEETDDATYEKYIMMTEQGGAAGGISSADDEAGAGGIFQLYFSDLQYSAQSRTVGGGAICERPAGSVPEREAAFQALKRLATFIKKIIERMLQEGSLESLTENILEYCQGDFIREYSRLTKQQNIHIYRSYIRAELEGMRNDPALFARIAEGCCREEELDAEAGRERCWTCFRPCCSFSQRITTSSCGILSIKLRCICRLP